MTIETTGNTIIAIADGVQTVFPFDFLVYTASSIEIYFNGLPELTGFIVSGLGNPDGGEIIFDVAPPNQAIVTIIRTLLLVQETDYEPYSAFPANTVEVDFDRTVMMCQQIQGQIDNTVLHLPEGYAYIQTELPPPEASKVLGWNGTADAIVNYSLGDIIQRVFLPSSQPIGDKTGIGAAWDAAGFDVTGTITVAYYGQVTYLLSIVSSPDDDDSWDALSLTAIYQSLISLGTVIAYWNNLDITEKAALSAGDVLIGDGVTSKEFYECKVGGNYLIDPSTDTYNDAGVGTHYISLTIANAPVKRDEFEALEQGLTNVATILIQSGLFIGFKATYDFNFLQRVTVDAGFTGADYVDWVIVLEAGNPITKYTDQDWEQGTNNGGVPASIPFAEGWFKRWGLSKALAALPTDVAWSPANDNGALVLGDPDIQLAGYNSLRQIGWDYITAPSRVARVGWYQGDEFLFRNAAGDYSYVGDSGLMPANQTITLSAPPNSWAKVQVFTKRESNLDGGAISGRTFVWVSPTDGLPTAPGFNRMQAFAEYTASPAINSMGTTNQFWVQVDANSEVTLQRQTDGNDSTLTVYLTTLGYKSDMTTLRQITP